MNCDEIFRCEDCGGNGPIRFLGHRETMPGDYCLICADMEKCGCCGEIVRKGFLTWKEDVRNYICENCLFDYKEVARYIRPLIQMETKIVPLPGESKEIKKAS